MMSLDLFRLTDRVAIVIGAGRAIGRGIALMLAGAGADVVVAELDDATGTTVAQEVRDLGRRVLAVKDRYNREWLIGRHGHQSPATAQAAFAATVAA